MKTGFLVLERMIDEVIHIGPDIEVVIVRVRSGGRVRVGVRAPLDLKILRGEMVTEDVGQLGASDGR